MNTEEAEAVDARATNDAEEANMDAVEAPLLPPAVIVGPPQRPPPAVQAGMASAPATQPDVPALAAAVVTDEFCPDMGFQEHDGKTSFRCHQCKLWAFYVF